MTLIEYDDGGGLRGGAADPSPSFRARASVRASTAPSPDRSRSSSSTLPRPAPRMARRAANVGKASSQRVDASARCFRQVRHQSTARRRPDRRTPGPSSCTSNSRCSTRVSPSRHSSRRTPRARAARGELREGAQRVGKVRAGNSSHQPCPLGSQGDRPRSRIPPSTGTRRRAVAADSRSMPKPGPS